MGWDVVANSDVGPSNNHATTEVEDAERRRSGVTPRQTTMGVVGPSNNHATTEEDFTRLAKLGVALCEKCVSVTVSRQRARENIGAPFVAR